MLRIGMLWFDNNPKADLKTKIERASVYFHEKYGGFVNRCVVHPSMITEETIKPDGIEVQTWQVIMPNYFWIGENNESS